ncbi:TatD family hydrolase [Deinococcus roseus]|uniref:3'-5' ssDNA/RNA exonuclease TatD n=1 Tax=Deinococcus roseus TaxID=392414 RepID=A0ABQ2CXF0_9DEIO|nr:TatD family hydrolase [Deinococcus roseus]GGJ30421.1 3'-5' ssDNA/RNA exonuclease TatD [Deinococcus roseus]
MIDIGINLAHRRFEKDLPQVIERAFQEGVELLVVTGTSLSSSQKALQISQQHGLVCTAGIHPHEARTHTPEIHHKLESLLQHPEVVAVGECGLDFDRNFSRPEDQERCFAAQLELAIQHQLPLFTHERAAHQKFLEMLKSAGAQLPSTVVHCFTGNTQQLRAYLDLGCWIGITGWITDLKRGQDLREALKYLPLDRLLVETDAPFLTPKNLPFRTDRNEPAYLPLVVREIARLLKKPETEIARITHQNAEQFFRLDWN